MPIRAYLVLLPLTGLLSACGSLSSGGSSCISSYQRPDWTRLITNLTQAESRWKAANIPTYKYSRTTINLARDFMTQVSVENDVVIRVYDEETKKPLDVNQASTINQLFVNLRDSMTRAKNDSKSCVMLDVSYDNSLGFPTKIDSADVTSGLQDAFGSLRISKLQYPVQ